MKKLLGMMCVFMLMLVCTMKVSALTYSDAYEKSDKTPMVVLLYAPWSDGYQEYIKQLKLAQNQMGNKFNFVELNIASDETKAFNEKYQIYPKLPYILMFRDRGKISRYISRDCAISSSCVVSKLKLFVQ